MISIYTDGACEPNPGQGGWSFVAYAEGSEILNEIGGEEFTTNNIMEMTAVLKALEWAEKHIAAPAKVKIYSDSGYVVNGCNDWRFGWAKKGWARGKTKPLANVEIWKRLAAAHDRFPAKIIWVKGHAGLEGNERADVLAEQGRLSVLKSIAA